MSRVLLLTICSNHKLESNEVVAYKPSWRLSEFLGERARWGLYSARRHVRDLITSDRVSRHGKLLRDLPFNQFLMDGPDFGNNTGRGSYLSALVRYNGRFYRELGNAADRQELSLRIKHHLLIVSGLYGVLTPTEQIQCYSCHVPDHPDIARAWREAIQADLTTTIITDYIRRFKIERVFDFMAADAYRNLVSWEMVRHAVNGNVLHCFSSQHAGPALLPSLGLLAKQFLTATEADLLSIQAHEKIDVPNDTVHFLPVPIPEPPLARELAAQAKIATLADSIGRMRRNLIKIVYVAAKRRPTNPFRIKALDLAGANVEGARKAARLLNQFADIRNLVEYENPSISDAMWKNVRRIYEELVSWAAMYGYLKGVQLEEVDLV
jgi:hypothetical protein